ncbi:MAG: MarC family protein [Candidatus Aenigmatarchaeota archaeon]
MGFIAEFSLSIIQLMVAIDAPGVLPMYIALTDKLKQEEKQRIVRQSVITAFVVTSGFVFLGRGIFRALSIEVEDFMIAGGILLLVISIADLIGLGEKVIPSSSTLGIVPLGTPLLAGPATLTTTLVLVGSYGYTPVLLSLLVNLFFAWIIFYYAERIMRIIGTEGAHGLAKIASLLLAAIAVKFIRTGFLKWGQATFS